MVAVVALENGARWWVVDGVRCYCLSRPSTGAGVQRRVQDRNSIVWTVVVTGMPIYVGECRIGNVSYVHL